MTTTSESSDTASPRPGRLSRALIRLWMKQARITKVERLAGSFRLLTLESPEFRGLRWVPGQKVQIAMGSAFAARTFTPIEWDAAAGRTRILGYAHGDAPGSAWLRVARPGDACDVFGPRASLDVGHVAGVSVVLGDETSIGLAYAISRHAANRSQPCLLEADDVATTRDVLMRLGLDGAELFERTANDTHLEDIARRLPALVADGTTFVLTGKATSIQRLRRTLKTLGVPASRLLTKPYWAPGKTGLD